MIIENSGLEGLKSELEPMDEAAEHAGFVRWQWEYYRATYDCQIREGGDDYFLRINARAVEGKLEAPDTVLNIEKVYIGKASFPHGVDYGAAIPDNVMQAATEKLAVFKKSLH